MRELPRDLTYHEFYTTSQEDIILFIATHYFDESKETYIDCIIGKDTLIYLIPRMLTSVSVQYGHQGIRR